MQVDVQKKQEKRTERALTEPFTLRRLSQEWPKEVWEVSNGEKGTVYHVTVNVDGGDVRCDCPDFTQRCAGWGIHCKHIEAVMLYYSNGGRWVPHNITVIDTDGEILLNGGAKMKNGNGSNGRIRIASTITQKAFLHVEDALSIGKVRLFAGNYEAGKGATAMVSHYLDWDVALAVFHQMLTGSRDGSFKFYGGSSKNGQVLSRTCRFDLKFTEGKVFIEVAEGPGKKTSTGAIQPAGKPTTSVTIALTPWQAAALAARVCAYLFGKGASVIEAENAGMEAPEAGEAGVEAEEPGAATETEGSAADEGGRGQNEATEKQWAYIDRLLNELGVPPEDTEEYLFSRGYDAEALTRKEASELIERLKAEIEAGRKPEEAGAGNRSSGSKSATEKQVKLVFTLLRELGYKTEERAREVLREKGYDPNNLSREQASELIERLKKARANGSKRGKRGR